METQEDTGKSSKIQKNLGKLRKIQENPEEQKKNQEKIGELWKNPDNFGGSLGYSNKVAQNAFMDKTIASLTKVLNE